MKTPKKGNTIWFFFRQYVAKLTNFFESAFEIDTEEDPGFQEGDESVFEINGFPN